MQSLEEIRVKNEVETQQLHDFIKEIQEYNQHCQQAEAEASASSSRKHRRFGRILESTLKHFVHHPLKIIPLVASIVLVPALAPSVSCALGVSEGVAVSVLSGSVGGISAAMQDKSIITGALVSSNVLGPIGTAVVNKENPLKTVATSLITKQVCGDNLLAETLTRPIVSSVLEKKSLSEGVAQGIVSSVIVGGTNVITSVITSVITNVMQDVRTNISNESTASDQSILQDENAPNSIPEKQKSSQTTTFKKNQGLVGTTPTSTHELSEEVLKIKLAASLMSAGDYRKCEVKESETQTENLPKVKGEITLSSKNMKVSVNGCNVGKDSIGFSRTKDGIAHTHEVKKSDIFKGGHAYVNSITTSSGQSNGVFKIGIQPIPSQVMSEQIYPCVALRTTQTQKELLDGAVQQVVSNEYHMDTQGCVLPGAGMVTTAILAPQMLPVVLPLAFQ